MPVDWLWEMERLKARFGSQGTGCGVPVECVSDCDPFRASAGREKGMCQVCLCVCMGDSVVLGGQGARWGAESGEIW